MITGLAMEFFSVDVHFDVRFTSLAPISPLDGPTAGYKNTMNTLFEQQCYYLFYLFHYYLLWNWNTLVEQRQYSVEHASAEAQLVMVCRKWAWDPRGQFMDVFVFCCHSFIALSSQGIAYKLKGSSHIFPDTF